MCITLDETKEHVEDVNDEASKNTYDEKVVSMCEYVINVARSLQLVVLFSSIVLHGFKRQIRWQYICDPLTKKDFDRIISCEEDAYFFIRFGIFLSCCAMYVGITDRFHPWFALFLIFEAIFILIVRNDTTLTSRFMILSFVSLLLLCIETVYERQMNTLEFGIVCFLFSCGIAQLFVSQDDTNVIHTQRMKTHRAVLCCVLKVLYNCIFLYSYFSADVWFGVLIVAVTLIGCNNQKVLEEFYEIMSEIVFKMFQVL